MDFAALLEGKKGCNLCRLFTLNQDAMAATDCVLASGAMLLICQTLQ